MIIFGPNSVWFWAMMQFIIVAVTLLLIYFQVRIQTASHIVSTINSLNTRWDSESMLRARLQCCQSWIDGKVEFTSISEIISEFFEDIGTIVRVKAVPKNVIWESHSWYIEYYYTMFQSGIEELRTEYKDSTLYTEFEWLFSEIQIISKKKGAPDFSKTSDELRKFLLSETEVAKTLLKLKDDE